MTNDQIAQDLKKYQLWENASSEIRAYENLLSEQAGDAEMADEVRETIAGLVAYRDSLLSPEEAERIGDALRRDREVADEYRMRGFFHKAFDTMKEHPEALLIGPALLPWWKNIRIVSGVTTIGVVAIALLVYKGFGGKHENEAVSATADVPETPHSRDTFDLAWPYRTALAVTPKTAATNPSASEMYFSPFELIDERGQKMNILILAHPMLSSQWDVKGDPKKRLGHEFAFVGNGDDVYNLIQSYKANGLSLRLPTFYELKYLIEHGGTVALEKGFGLEWCSEGNGERVLIYTVDPVSHSVTVSGNSSYDIEGARIILKRNFNKGRTIRDLLKVTPTLHLIKSN